MGFDIIEKTTESAEQKPTCQVCGKAFDIDTAIVRCSKCKTFHHLDCWQFSRGCSVYACNGRMYDRLDESEQKSIIDPSLVSETSFKVCQPAVLLSTFTFVFLLIAMMASIGGGVEIVKALMLHKFFGLLWVMFSTLCLIALPVLYNSFYYKLECAPKTGIISRQPFLYGYEVGEEEEWLSIDEIVEIHFHTTKHISGRKHQQLFLVLDDGSRIKIEDTLNPLIQAPPWRSTNLEELAQRLAEFSDTTIRLVQGTEAPPVDEVLESARARALLTEKNDQAFTPSEDTDNVSN